MDKIDWEKTFGNLYSHAHITILKYPCSVSSKFLRNFECRHLNIYLFSTILIEFILFFSCVLIRIIRMFEKKINYECVMYGSINEKRLNRSSNKNDNDGRDWKDKKGRNNHFNIWWWIWSCFLLDLPHFLSSSINIRLGLD